MCHFSKANSCMQHRKFMAYTIPPIKMQSTSSGTPPSSASGRDVQGAVVPGMEGGKTGEELKDDQPIRTARNSAREEEFRERARSGECTACMPARSESTHLRVCMHNLMRGRRQMLYMYKRSRRLHICSPSTLWHRCE